MLRFIDIAVDALAGAREEIDALNVYPVPDGDTGTNLYLTMAAARDAVRERTGGAHDGDRAATMEAFTRGALLGARGNSGVILSEMLRAIIRRIARGDAGRAERRRHGRRAAQGHRGVVRRGRHAGRGHHAQRVPRRRRGGRGAARRAARTSGRATSSPRRPPRPARRSPARRTSSRRCATPGVVDAGGRGVVVILDAAETALTGRMPPKVESARTASRSRW